MTKTVQLGLRIDKELLEKIEYLAEHEGIDKMSWIRRALANFASDEEDGMSDAAIEDYIRLRISEKDLKEYTGFSKIPKDIQDARKRVLSNVLKKNVKE